MATIKAKWYDEEILAAIMEIAEEGLDAAGAEGQNMVESRVPVDTGFLKSQQRYEVTVDPHDLKVQLVLGDLEDAVPYAKYQERRTAYLRSTLDDLAPLIPSFIEDAGPGRLP